MECAGNFGVWVSGAGTGGQLLAPHCAAELCSTSGAQEIEILCHIARPMTICHSRVANGEPLHRPKMDLGGHGFKGKKKKKSQRAVWVG